MPHSFKFFRKSGNIMMIKPQISVIIPSTSQKICFKVEKPFVEETEFVEKREPLATLNALLNMDEKGDDAIGMDDEPEEENGEREISDKNFYCKSGGNIIKYS